MRQMSEDAWKETRAELAQALEEYFATKEAKPLSKKPFFGTAYRGESGERAQPISAPVRSGFDAARCENGVFGRSVHFIALERYADLKSGSFEPQVDQLLEFIASKLKPNQRNQRTDFLAAFNSVTNSNLTLESLNEANLKAIIGNKCHHSVDELKSLLEGVRSNLSGKNNLLEEYGIHTPMDREAAVGSMKEKLPFSREFMEVAADSEANPKCRPWLACVYPSDTLPLSGTPCR